MTQDAFKQIMSSLGEKLSDEELREILKDCNIATDGTINYEGNEIFLLNINYDYTLHCFFFFGVNIDFVKTVTAQMQ